MWIIDLIIKNQNNLNVTMKAFQTKQNKTMIVYHKKRRKHSVTIKYEGKNVKAE